MAQGRHWVSKGGRSMDAPEGSKGRHTHLPGLHGRRGSQGLLLRRLLGLSLRIHEGSLVAVGKQVQRRLLRQQACTPGRNACQMRSQLSRSKQAERGRLSNARSPAQTAQASHDVRPIACWPAIQVSSPDTSSTHCRPRKPNLPLLICCYVIKGRACVMAGRSTSM